MLPCLYLHDENRLKLFQGYSQTSDSHVPPSLDDSSQTSICLPSSVVDPVQAWQNELDQFKSDAQKYA